jgi:hypothetical protein
VGSESLSKSIFCYLTSAPIPGGALILFAQRRSTVLPRPLSQKGLFSQIKYRSKEKQQFGAINSFYSASNQNMAASTNNKGIEWLPASFVPGKKDVIVGRGKVCYKHSGNQRLARIVTSVLQAYSSAGSTKKAKSELIKNIVVQIRESSPEVGFVKYDSGSSKWYEVGDRIAREKVSQTFRDALNDQYKSSTTSKTLKRRQERINRQTSVGSADSSTTAGVAECTECPDLDSSSSRASSPLFSRPQAIALPMPRPSGLILASLASKMYQSDYELAARGSLGIVGLALAARKTTLDDIILARQRVREAFAQMGPQRF